jgi:hypothetical protein
MSDSDLDLALALLEVAATEPLRNEEIAAWCGCSPDAIYRIFAQAIRKLRAALFSHVRYSHLHENDKIITAWVYGSLGFGVRRVRLHNLRLYGIDRRRSDDRYRVGSPIEVVFLGFASTKVEPAEQFSSDPDPPGRPRGSPKTRSRRRAHDFRVAERTDARPGRREEL